MPNSKSTKRIELNDRTPVVAAISVISALALLRQPSTLDEIMGTIEAIPHVRVTAASRGVVEKVLRDKFLVARVGEDAFRLVESL